MSSPLALAAVTATLCDLLNNGLIDNDLAQVGSFSVTALPPDRIETGNNEGNRLNLFLYQITPNLGWRNEGLPSHDARAPRARLSNPPLALDLHYMLTAYGAADWAAEILLGYAMELLHDARGLTRQNIRDALSPNNPISVALIPPDGQGRQAIDLADQIEQIKITPHYLSADELSRLWTAMQARYRPTVAYQVSTVLIQSTRSTRAPLPVLTQGKADSGIQSQPNTRSPIPARPTLRSLEIIPAIAGEKRLAAEQGDMLELSGALLDGDEVTAEFRHPRLAKPNVLPLEDGAMPERVRVCLPQSNDNAKPGFDADADENWPAGHYTVALRIKRAGKLDRLTDEWPFSLVPRLSGVPQVAGSAMNPQVTLSFFPQLWPEQRAEVFVGGEPFTVGPVVAKTGTLSLSLEGITPTEGAVPLTLRIDGVSSQLVRDRNARPPQFDSQQMVTLPL